jgi:hypothetical protein
MVRKIFVTLITVVTLVLIGAIVLNSLLPNITAQVINAVEGAIFKATGLNFNFNGDSISGNSVGTDPGAYTPGGTAEGELTTVEGFN